jgi:hypothetical protein
MVTRSGVKVPSEDVDMALAVDEEFGTEEDDDAGPVLESCLLL